jgi:hypothetical protein
MSTELIAAIELLREASLVEAGNPDRLDGLIGEHFPDLWREFRLVRERLILSQPDPARIVMIHAEIIGMWLPSRP